MSRSLYILVTVCLFINLLPGNTQDFAGQNDYIQSTYEPLVLKISDDGSKYVRFILWNQFWVEDQNLADNEGYLMKIRRSRVVSYAQISPRFMILTHFGLNSLNTNTMDPLGNGKTAGNGPQLFLHAAWSEFKISKDESMYLGAGLHYWNGLSRFNAASTLNFATLDNHRQSWAHLGLSDQFGRHLGLFLKGEKNKFVYSISLNEAITNALGSEELENLTEGSITYSGKRVFGQYANKVFTGRVEYQLLDRESGKLPYRTGTYLGQKRILNFGAGFYNHRNGTVLIERGPEGQNVDHYAADIFYDAPIGKGAINAYASVHKLDYGPDFTYGYTYGTGLSIYLQAGYLIPVNTAIGQLMPYTSYGKNSFDAFDQPGNTFQTGLNLFINGHNAKVTLEYRSSLVNYDVADGKPDRINGLVIQTHVFL